MTGKPIRFSDILIRIIWILALTAFGFVLINGLFVSCRVNFQYSETNNEHVEFFQNTVPLLLLFLTTFLIALTAAESLYVSENTVRIGKIILGITVFSVSVFWIRESAPVPYADSKFCLDIASMAASGVPVTLEDLDYLRLYPFQAGFVLYGEILFRMLGRYTLSGMWILNAAWLVLFDLAMIRISEELFGEPKITLLTEILLLILAQPVFLSTFLYGTIPGSALGAAGMVFLIRFWKTDRIRWGIGAAVLLGLAVSLKLNLAVTAIAACLLLIIRILRRPAWKPVGILMLIIFCAAAFPALAKARYELLCGTGLGPGFPRTGHLLMGLSESSMCSGWHNANVPLVFIHSGYDAESANAAYLQEIGETVQHFLNRPRYLASFFYHKLTSQWNTPSFQGIWSAAVSHDPHKVMPLAVSLFSGSGAEAAEHWFLGITTLVYAGFVGCLAAGIRRKETSEAGALIPLMLFGYFLYYALFEAKAQYVILTVPCMIPAAAFFWVRSAQGLRGWIRKKGERT